MRLQASADLALSVSTPRIGWNIMRIAASLALTVVVSGPAIAADTIFSAMAFGGPSQAVAVCYYSTDARVKFRSSNIVSENGLVLPNTTGNCASDVNLRCRTVANINNSVPNACFAVVNKSEHVRGRLEIRDSANNVLTTETIR